LVNKSNLPGAYEQWGKLQSVDHFFFMRNESNPINEVYKNPLSPGNSEEAFTNYKNALLDFEIKLIKKGLSDIKDRYKYAGSLNLY
jgi:hypothetical protein